ncbi:hypothetical protein V6N11_037103 [Hibiscus sabdariffa]|uniref:Uncharacterized protein n=1 Tax=Hibiscus sabdariffa TaxID=183260 RepID=A0ABR1ZYG0_9ROSI
MKANSRFFTIRLVNILVLIQHWCLVEQIFTKQLRLQIPNLLDQTACSLLSYTTTPWLKMVPMQAIRSRVQFLKISALSLVFCVSVVLGNISLRFLQEHESSPGLNTLANAAILGDNVVVFGTKSVATTVKHPSTLMMRKKKRQWEREAEIAQRNQQAWGPREEAEVDSSSKQVPSLHDPSENEAGSEQQPTP